jgi:hypothetical protein
MLVAFSHILALILKTGSYCVFVVEWLGLFLVFLFVDNLSSWVVLVVVFGVFVFSNFFIFYVGKVKLCLVL